MEDIYCFAGNPLDRASERRRDTAWVRSLLDDPAARILPLRDLLPFTLKAGRSRVSPLTGRGVTSDHAASDAARLSRMCVLGRLRDLPVGLAARAIAHGYRSSNLARRPDTGHRHGWCARDGGCVGEGWRLHTSGGAPGRVRRPPRDYPPLRFNCCSDAGQRSLPSRRMDGSPNGGNSLLAARRWDCPSRWQGYRGRAARCCAVAGARVSGEGAHAQRCSLREHHVLWRCCPACAGRAMTCVRKRPARSA